MVQNALKAKGFGSELVSFTTVGDKRLDKPLSAIGAKGLFTKELEVALLKNEVDCCVHSLKDLPTESPDGLSIVAQLEREDPRDAVVCGPGSNGFNLRELPSGARVGSSSLRRRAQLLHMRPDLEIVDLRGNVPTRLEKIQRGLVDCAILAAAGLIRLDATSQIHEYLDPPGWLPAPGQGAIAIQARSDDDAMCTLLRSLDHAATSFATRAERAFLAALEGGCQVPIGALVKDDILHGMIARPDGEDIIRGFTHIDHVNPESAAQDLAYTLSSKGGDAILAGLKKNREALTAPQPE